MRPTPALRGDVQGGGWGEDVCVFINAEFLLSSNWSRFTTCFSELDFVFVNESELNLDQELELDLA